MFPFPCIGLTSFSSFVIALIEVCKRGNKRKIPAILLIASGIGGIIGFSLWLGYMSGSNAGASFYLFTFGTLFSIVFGGVALHRELKSSGAIGGGEGQPFAAGGPGGPQYVQIGRQ